VVDYDKEADEIKVTGKKASGKKPKQEEQN
jgi:hypothetical protein